MCVFFFLSLFFFCLSFLGLVVLGVWDLGFRGTRVKSSVELPVGGV